MNNIRTSKVKKEEGVQRQQQLPFKKSSPSLVLFPKPQEYDIDSFEVKLKRPATNWAAEKISEFLEELKKSTPNQFKKSGAVGTKNSDGDMALSLSWVRMEIVISTANKVFGFNGWNSSIVEDSKVVNSEVIIEEDLKKENYIERLLRLQEEEEQAKLPKVKKEKPEEEEKKVNYSYSVEVRTTIMLSLKDGTYITKDGTGSATNPQKNLAFQLAKKQAATNALKQCFCSFPEMLKNHQQRWKLRQFNWG
ncbi:hypothetical protein DASC09_016510 [Saccharomycopsis crataegensis]|uniref:DNA repair and recombination protein RAD52 n=1 Tax=Saccharomycopsis crataegensis TaxID=43959 RepID=A0AAV5QI14_9ASCO|nr:hypothetical protein DASC09_016510 [Saccharomycopsis crataegensis]